VQESWRRLADFWVTMNLGIRPELDPPESGHSVAFGHSVFQTFAIKFYKYLMLHNLVKKCGECEDFLLTGKWIVWYK